MLERARGIGAVLAVYRHPRVVAMLFLGFSAGLPLLLLFGTLSFWLREAGVSRTAIGFFSWVGLAYGIKWAWAPLVDRLPLPWLTRRMGRRRSWLLAAQLTIAMALAGMALQEPQSSLTALAVLAVLVAFGSATQDIALDAYRIEAVAREMQAAMAATYMAGYRLAMIVAGAGALGIAALVDPSSATYEVHPWRVAYLSMAALMGVGILTTLLIHEPEVRASGDTREREARGRAWLARNAHLPGWLARGAAWFYGAVVSPFLDFILRYRWHALMILALIASYRMSDVVLGIMSNAFYVDMGFTKGEVATITKVYGVIMTLLGAGLAGVFMTRVGVLPVLFVGGLLAAGTNLLFAFLATVGDSLPWLTVVVSADNLSAGVATAAFIAYLSGLTNVAYSATQYALFSSVMLLLPKFVGGFSGMAVDGFGYVRFFVGTAALGLPVLVLIVLVARWERGRPANDD